MAEPEGWGLPWMPAYVGQESDIRWGQNWGERSKQEGVPGSRVLSLVGVSQGETPMRGGPREGGVCPDSA